MVELGCRRRERLEETTEMKITANKRNVKANKSSYLYFTKHGIGPGTLPKDAKLLDWRDIDDNITAIWLNRFLTTAELKEYDIYPETSEQHKMYSKKLNSCKITASTPGNSYQHYYAYDYKGKNRFSIHYDDVTDIEDPELSFQQFRCSVSLIKPYDNADYAWARIQNGSIDYFRKGKLIKKEYYFMFSDYGTDEDPLYENANEWITDVTDHACDTLIELNQNIEPRIIHNSTTVASSEYDARYIVERPNDATYDKDEDELQEIIDELVADGFDVTDEDDLLMGLSADLGMDKEDAQYYTSLILNRVNASEVIDAVADEITNKKYLRMKRQYKNRKSFKDREAESGNIQDLIDDLKNKGVSYEIYEDTTDAGCTIFFDETDSVYSSFNYNDDVDTETEWVVLDAKRVLDSDGFYTDYTLYTNEDEDIYICMLGDKDLYGPDIDYADYETDDENAAWEWFNNYEGFADDDVYSSEGLKSSELSDAELSDDAIDKILGDLEADLHQDILTTMTSEGFGFDKKEAEEYSNIEVTHNLGYDRIKIEVGAELSYDGLDELRRVLDDRLRYYVKDAYFDMEDPGLLSTYFSREDIIPDDNDVVEGSSIFSDETFEDEFNVADTNSDYESDSGIFIEDIIDSLEDNGYDLSRIRSIRQGLLELFGYKGEDADIIIHDLIAGRFIDPNDWVDKDYISGIYSAIEEDEEENWFLKSVPQEYTSENTSINKAKLPAVYNLIKLKPGSLVVDFGGGKWDTAVEHFAKEDITILVYDPYNRSAEHNREVLKILRENGGADAAVNSNVLNVIKEPEARKNVLENIARITKPGAPIYITVYEGRGDNQEGPTKSGYQLNRKTADYLEEIQEVFPDATRKGKLIIAHNSSSVTSFTNVELYEDDQHIDRADKDIDLYDLMAIKDVEDTDGSSTEYAIYQIILKDGSIEYECYFGDSGIYGPWNGDGLDFESKSYDEAVDWYNNYESEDVTTSTITSARNDSKILTTEEIDAMMDNLADLHSAIIDTMTSEEFGFDEKDPEYYTKIDICPDPDYDGIRIEVDAELSYHELDKLREVLDKTLNKYVKHAHFDVAEPGILETYFASSDIIPDNISSSKIVAGRYDVPERPLDPPEYDEGDEIQTEASVVIPFNQVITVNQDGSWDYSDDEYNFTKTEDGRSDHYDDEYHVYLDDNIGIVEKLDDFLESKLPATPGTYRIQGDLTLVYDIENIVSYSNNDGYWSEEDGFNPPSYEISTDSAESYYNKSKSHLDNFKYTKIK